MLDFTALNDLLGTPATLELGKRYDGDRSPGGGPDESETAI
jgi:hypothetical protein